MINIIIELITNFAILSLCLGIIIGIYSDFKINNLMSSIISLYLIFIIGLKGGICLGISNSCTPPLIILALCGIIIGLIQPFIYLKLLSYITKLDMQTKTVIASQYGSISIVTFVTAITFLEKHGIAYNTFMSAIAGLMEIPAIIIGLILLRSRLPKTNGPDKKLIKILSEMICSPKINFIFIGFIFGYLFRNHQDHIITQALLYPFTFFLILFMIDIGIKIADQRDHIHHFTWSLIAFGILTPIFSGCFSLIISYFLNINIGSTVLFAVLIGSASYIAVPAIMAVQAPNAKKAIYLPLALGITLPFNLIFGIPLFYWIASLNLIGKICQHI